MKGYPANIDIGPQIYELMAHFGGSPTAVAKKLHLTVDTVKRYQREKRVPFSLMKRFIRETCPRLKAVMEMAKRHQFVNPLLRHLNDDQLGELYDIVVNLHENWDGEDVVPSYILQQMCERYKRSALKPSEN